MFLRAETQQHRPEAVQDDWQGSCTRAIPATCQQHCHAPAHVCCPSEALKEDELALEPKTRPAAAGDKDCYGAGYEAGGKLAASQQQGTRGRVDARKADTTPDGEPAWGSVTAEHMCCEAFKRRHKSTNTG